MLRKNIVIIFLVCVAIQVASPEEAQFRVLDDTPAWIPRTVDTLFTDSTADIIIPRGSIISEVSHPSPHFLINGNPSVGHISVFFEGTRYRIAANTFVPIDTEELFHESFLTSANPQAEIWVNSYFLKVVHSADRNVLIPYEQGWIDTRGTDDIETSFLQANFDRSLEITQGTVSIGGLSRDQFLIKRIEHIPSGYRVTVTWNTRMDGYYWPRARSAGVNLPSRNAAPVFCLYFIFDCDYLDVYYSTDRYGLDRVFSTSFVRIDYEIRSQLNEFIRYYHPEYHPISLNLERITFWPRRADGTMDFPPPAGSPVAGEILAETAFIATEFEIHAHVPEEPPPPAAEAMPEVQPAPVAEAQSRENEVPLRALLAIAGGAVAVVGGLAVLLARKKDSTSHRRNPFDHS